MHLTTNQSQIEGTRSYFQCLQLFPRCISTWHRCTLYRASTFTFVIWFVFYCHFWVTITTTTTVNICQNLHIVGQWEAIPKDKWLLFCLLTGQPDSFASNKHGAWKQSSVVSFSGGVVYFTSMWTNSCKKVKMRIWNILQGFLKTKAKK